MQMAIANIERVDIITEETIPQVMSFDTASEANAEAQISSGSEPELRVKNRILAQNITEDIVKGYNISLTDATFSPDVFALIDGGQSTITDGGFAKYAAPIAGEVVTRTRSRLAVYASEKDYDGHSLSYIAFIFPHAYGAPSSVSMRDGEFFAPSYTVKSRPGRGESPMTMLCLPSLPVIVKSSADLPASPVSGQTTILVAGSLDSAGDLPIGSYAVWNGTAYTTKA